MLRFLFFMILFISSLQGEAIEITELKTGTAISLEDFLQGELDQKTLVLGESHYDKLILKAHAQIIQTLVKRDHLENNFSTGWEFLEYDYDQEIQKAFFDWKNAVITDEEYLKRIFPQSTNPLVNLPYLDFMDVTARFGGNIITTNATRETKKLLRQQGIGALEPKDQPDEMLEGSINYFARFKKIMEDHVPASELASYFLAQYYTDNIIGTYLERMQTGSTTFLVIGSFHMEYNDGVVEYLKKHSQHEIVSLKIVNKNELTQDEYDLLKESHPEYGHIADYLIGVE